KNQIYDFLKGIVKNINTLGLKLQFNIEGQSSTKAALVNDMLVLFRSAIFRKDLRDYLTKDEKSAWLYERLVWDSTPIPIEYVNRYHKFNFKDIDYTRYGWNEKQLSGSMFFVTHRVYYTYRLERDEFVIKDSLRNILKYLFPLPSDYLLQVDDAKESCEYEYENSDGVINFISTIKSMLDSSLVEFGKTNEKPLAKSLNILKSTSAISEFFEDKKLSSLATDMLTRSFYYYYHSSGAFYSEEYKTLKNILKLQMRDKLPFFITRIFLSHLKKVRFDSFYSSEKELFDLVEHIISDMPKDGYVSVDNIVKYCRYRDIRVNIDSSYKSKDYHLECDVDGYEFSENLYVNDYYEVLFFEPILKATLFYLGALGLLTLKYDRAKSPYTIRAKNSEYISVWDSLKYIKLTKLGMYVFGYEDSYEQKKIEVSSTNRKFDEYKPIVTIDEKDIIMMAKLDSFCDKIDTNRYALSYIKLFKDCKNIKALEAKIDSFYKNIEPNPPQVFNDFFDEIRENSNMLKRDLKQVVIDLNNNKKLLNLFMSNKKLQEIVTKAQGYKIIVHKDNISKLTKIVKDNGFFIDF
ncbi:MAG: hypothetical protein U9N42_05990, partial [Campylobacterota bacterium]|nr:hypothetical protein [Campylobacterota bacterium]